MWRFLSPPHFRPFEHTCPHAFLWVLRHPFPMCPKFLFNFLFPHFTWSSFSSFIFPCYPSSAASLPIFPLFPVPHVLHISFLVSLSCILGPCHLWFSQSFITNFLFPSYTHSFPFHVPLCCLYFTMAIYEEELLSSYDPFTFCFYSGMNDFQQDLLESLTFQLLHFR